MDYWTFPKPCNSRADGNLWRWRLAWNVVVNPFGNRGNLLTHSAHKCETFLPMSMYGRDDIVVRFQKLETLLKNISCWLRNMMLGDSLFNEILPCIFAPMSVIAQVSGRRAINSERKRYECRFFKRISFLQVDQMIINE